MKTEKMKNQQSTLLSEINKRAKEIHAELSSMFYYGTPSGWGVTHTIQCVL